MWNSCRRSILCCGSQSEARDGSSSKLMADLPKSQGPEWVLYEDLPEDGEIVSFNQAGDGDGAFEICQREDGAVGTIAETTQGGAVCDTKDGAKDSFYVLVDQQSSLSPRDDSNDEDSGINLSDRITQGFYYEFSDEAVDEMYEALATTNAWQNALEAEASHPEHGIKKEGILLKGFL
jgi:hypothetical protein